jgi:hypothetical protein
MLGGENVNDVGWFGDFEIITDDERFTIKNRITNAGLNLLRNALNGEVTSCEIKYLALGTNSNVINDNDTQLGNEIFRAPFVTTTKPDIGQLEKTVIILDNEAVAPIEEIGIFAGVTASNTTNSGIMISRVLYSRNKTNLESIQIVRRDSIQRG